MWADILLSILADYEDSLVRLDDRLQSYPEQTTCVSDVAFIVRERSHLAFTIALLRKVRQLEPAHISFSSAAIQQTRSAGYVKPLSKRQSEALFRQRT
jgi:hypothetical protein